MNEKKSATEWLNDPVIQDQPAKIVGIQDPDGWRRDDGVTLDTPITLLDFKERLGQSTVKTHSA